MTDKAQEQAPANEQPFFNIEKLYVKDLSLELPHAPAIFLVRENPQIDMQLQSQAASVEDGVFEVIVTATVTAKLPEKDKVMFLIEAKQAGIFQIRNLPPAEMETMLAVVCPNILYPYLREVVSDASVRGGFAPVMLNPINFEAIYHQQKQQAQAQPQTEGAETKH
ncbi:MAG: protein-export chaperone SecB [Gammaproteobacteria bacterium]|nr:protein-export chaperone SecB [Gammaproteobacteria bacterium]MBU1776021.1 protein-export chaperone SecB [Gammaproteobacteria bacterium]MBU1968379.1 protein-export chaperone SecB [Gammaproteobacteria bacterium]